MSVGVPIRFAAFGQQYVYANVDELLAGAERLETEAKLLWGQRQLGTKGVGETAVIVRDRLSAIAAHLDMAKKILQAEDQEMERACAEIETLLGEL